MGACKWALRALTEPNAKERQRCRRRFRHHVRTPRSNPKGRIHKESCGKCGDWEAEAHHIDYDRPFVVVWLCLKCHRKVERGALKIFQKDIWDYTGLLVRRPGGYVETKLKDVPF